MQLDELRNKIALYSTIIKAINDQIESLVRDKERFMKELTELISEEIVPIIREEIGLRVSVDIIDSHIMLKIEDDLGCDFWDASYNEIKKFIKNRFPELYDLLL